MRSCNYAQGERERKGFLTVFSNLAHPQISTSTCMDCMYGQHCRAETPSRTGRVPWRRGTEFSWRKSWNMARLQDISEQRVVHPYLALVLTLAVYMLKLRHLSGSVLLKPELSRSEQATDSWFIAVLWSPSPARLQHCTCSAVLKWSSPPQTNLETRPLSLFLFQTLSSFQL